MDLREESMNKSTDWDAALGVLLFFILAKLVLG
jgi:hypothetical protein